MGKAGRTDLDFTLEQAEKRGATGVVQKVAALRYELLRAAINRKWSEYNDLAKALTQYGATIPLVTIQQEPQENNQMGMFDAPQYLTGKENGFVKEGDEFYLHNARLDGQVKIGNEYKDQVKLLVSYEKDGEKVVVYSAGAGVVNQIKRMDANDRQNMPLHLRLDTLPSRQGSPTNIMTPADQSPPSGTGFGGGSEGTDF